VNKRELECTLKRIIKIDRDLCTLCSDCVIECIGGAKVILDSDNEIRTLFFCEGLGGCAKKCPEAAITFEIKES
jgi:MinD superfamily P-loop ATPase